MSFIIILLLIGAGLVVAQQQQQVIEQTGVAGISTNVNIMCNLGCHVAAPFWIINGTVYELFSISYAFLSGVIPVVNSYSSLTIPRLIEDLNGVDFQCAIFDEDRARVIYGTITQIRVLPNPDPESTELFAILSSVRLGINFNSLLIEPDEVLVEWAPSKNSDCANASYELQGYTLSNIQGESLDTPIIVIAGGQQNSARILRDQLRSANNVTLFYRLVALFENGTICEHTTDNRFYDFANSPVIDTRVVPRNTMTCFDIPSDNTCTTNFIWPASADQSRESCICPVYHGFMNCPCNQDSSSVITPQLMENGSICLSSPLEETLVHFQCTRDLCVGGTQSCTITTIKSQMVVSAEPPDSPDVTHNDSFLCLSAYSHAELPVLYFDVVVMDVTGIPSDLTGRHYVTSGNKVCLPITSDPTPNICPPIQVSATATNAVGESEENVTSNIGFRNGQDYCNCYSDREQIMVMVDVVSRSADMVTVDVECDLVDIGRLDFLLNSLRHNFSCGRNFISGLRSGRHVLYRRYSDDVQCRVTEFSVDEITIPPDHATTVSTISTTAKSNGGTTAQGTASPLLLAAVTMFYVMIVVS